MALGEADFRQLIPLLHPRTRIQDMDVLKAWYEAVTDALRGELQADLLAIWIFGPDGEPILLEPEALLEDNLEVPRAAPILDQQFLDDLDRRIRRAGYGSVMLKPVRHGGQDVGLILLASFTPHLYGLQAEGLLDATADVIAPMLARVVRASAAPEEPMLEHPAAQPEPEMSAGDRERDQAQEGELFETLADAIGGAGTPRDLMLALSFALQQILPHDGYELLIPDNEEENYYRLSLHGHGTLWEDRALTVPRERFDARILFGDRAAVLIEDAPAPPEAMLPELVAARGAERPPRSVVAVKLRVVERTIGYLFFGSAGPGFYGRDDLELLDRIGALIAPRIEGLVLAWQYSVLRSQFDALRHIPVQLARAAELLASTPFLGEGSRLFAQLAGALLPLTGLEFAVRLADEQRVAVMKPGNAVPLADLPQEPIEGTGVAAVVRGEAPFLFTTDEDEEGGKVGVLVVPLRAGGRIFGAMAVTAADDTAFSPSDMALAQQLADLAAPHLDLARQKTGPAAPPYIPGWKRPSLRPERESQGQ